MTSTYSRIRATGTALFDDAVADGADPQPTVAMAEGASRQALNDAGLTPADVDFLVIGTTSPDIVFPNAGCLLQQRMDIRGCAAFSLEAGPTGFLYALNIADRFIGSGQATCALVIGADSLAGSADGNGGETQASYAAAAGAVVLESASEPGIISSHLGADPIYKKSPPQAVAQGQADNIEDNSLEAPGTDVFKSAVESLRGVVVETLGRSKLTSDEINWMITQRSDPAVIQATSRGLGISMQKVIMVPEDYGDLVTASIPVALDREIRNGRISDGDLLLLAALGGAVTWGSALIRI